MTLSPKETLQKAREQSDGWIEHDGNGMPVARDSRVNVRFRDGVAEVLPEEPETADFWQGGHPDIDMWISRGGPNDIVAYRLHTPSPSSPEPQP